MNTKKGISDDGRIYSFDVMRIIACFAVVMIHISADLVKAMPIDTMDFKYGNLLESLSRFAVPMFIMISGALMLNERKPISTRKILYSALNIFILLFIWSVLYSVAYNIIRPLVFGESVSLLTVIRSVFDGHYHMWYLFVLIGLYLITPFLRTFIKKENSCLIRNYLLFSIAVCFCGSFINEFVNLYGFSQDLILDYLSKYRMDYVYEYLIYYILGWYIMNVEIKKANRIFIYTSGLLGLFITYICTQIFYDNANSVNYFYSNDSLNIFLYSTAIFVFLHYLIDGNSFRINRHVLVLSKLTFGVYLIHPVFLFIFKIICKSITNSLVKVLATFSLAIIASFVSMYIMSKIPILKKLIRA